MSIGFFTEIFTEIKNVYFLKNDVCQYSCRIKLLYFSTRLTTRFTQIPNLIQAITLYVIYRKMSIFHSDKTTSCIGFNATYSCANQLRVDPVQRSNHFCFTSSYTSFRFAKTSKCSPV